MPWRYGVRFLVLLLPCLVAMGLIVAFHSATAPRPVAAAVSATPQAVPPPGGLAGRPQPVRPADARGPMAMRHHPPQWGNPRAFADRRPMPGPAPHHPPVGAGRLLGVFAITGALTLLIFALVGSFLPERLTASPASEQELTTLREEVDRLQRERRQLRLALDWQERLLARTGQNGDEERPALPE